MKLDGGIMEIGSTVIKEYNIDNKMTRERKEHIKGDKERLRKVEIARLEACLAEAKSNE